MEISQKIAVSFIALVVFFKSEAQINDTSCTRHLLNSFMSSKFRISLAAGDVDADYIKFRNVERRFCIAKRGEKFNRTDVIAPDLCNVRLVLYGYSNTNGVKVILYEEFQGGSVGKTCDVYQISEGSLLKRVSFFVPQSTNSINQLKKAIRANQYSIEDANCILPNHDSQ